MSQLARARQTRVGSRDRHRLPRGTVVFGRGVLGSGAVFRKGGFTGVAEPGAQACRVHQDRAARCQAYSEVEVDPGEWDIAQAEQSDDCIADCRARRGDVQDRRSPRSQDQVRVLAAHQVENRGDRRMENGPAHHGAHSSEQEAASDAAHRFVDASAPGTGIDQGCADDRAHRHHDRRQPEHLPVSLVQAGAGGGGGSLRPVVPASVVGGHGLFTVASVLLRQPLVVRFPDDRRRHPAGYAESTHAR